MTTNNRRDRKRGSREASVVHNVTTKQRRRNESVDEENDKENVHDLQVEDDELSVGRDISASIVAGSVVEMLRYGHWETIPSQIEMQRQLEELRKEYEALKEQMLRQHQELLEKLVAKVTENLLKNNVQVVPQITKNDLNAAIDNSVNRILNATVNHTVPIDQQPNINNERSMSRDIYDTWDWDGKMGRHVPEGWSFPRCSVKAICDLFITGSPFENKRIRPYRKMELSTLKREDQSLFSRANAVFKMIQATAIEQKYFTGNLEDFENIGLTEWDKVFSDTYNHLLKKHKQVTKKPIPKGGEISYCTFYGWLFRSNKQLI